jgi:hypothetical protein
MRTLLTVAVSVFVLMTFPLIAPAQICGNVNGVGIVDLADLSYIVSYLGYGLPVPPNPALADMDGHTGITVGDAHSLTRYLFGVGPMLNCTPWTSYSFAMSPIDTFIMPVMLAVPDGTDSVALPVITNLSPESWGIYIPFLPRGPVDNGLFHLQAITKTTSSNSVINWFASGDTTTLIALFDPSHPSPVGRKVTFTLHYLRNAPGAADIAPALIARTAQWLPSFTRNDDLLRPQTIYEPYVVPPETLKTTPGQLSFATDAGHLAADSFLVSFSSNSIPVSFNLSGSDPWIILKNLPPTPLTTPTSIWVKADATLLGAGTYNGSITMTPVKAGVPATPASIPVTLTAALPPIYPVGDFNCDGASNLADLSTLISYLTGGGGTLIDCNHRPVK